MRSVLPARPMPARATSLPAFDLQCGESRAAQRMIARLAGQGFPYEPDARLRLLLDIPRGFALRMLEAGAGRAARLVVITFNFSPEYWEDLWDWCPAGLIVDTAYEPDGADALLEAARGRPYRHTPARQTVLSLTERQILRYVARGWINKQIADHMYFQEQTIRNNLSEIYSKLHVRNRSEALLYYWGLWPALDPLTPGTL